MNQLTSAVIGGGQHLVVPEQPTDPDVRFGGSYFNDLSVGSQDLKLINKSKDQAANQSSQSATPISQNQLEEQKQPAISAELLAQQAYGNRFASTIIHQ